MHPIRSGLTVLALVPVLALLADGGLRRAEAPLPDPMVWWPVRAERVDGARMTRSSVLRLAGNGLREHGIDPNDYVLRDLFYQPANGEWIAFFEDPARCVGCHACVTVRDRDGSTSFSRPVPGAGADSRHDGARIRGKDMAEASSGGTWLLECL